MKKIYILMLLMMSLLLGCQSEFYHQDESIDLKVKEQTDSVIAEIVENIKNNKVYDIQVYDNKEFGSQTKTAIIEGLNTLAPIYQENSQTLIGEFHGNTNSSSSNVTFTAFEELEGYTFKLPTKGEQYIKFYKVKNGTNELVIIFTLTKKTKWKLSSLSIANYKMLKRTNVEWHNKALELKEQGYELSAALHDLYAYYCTAIPYTKHDLSKEIIKGAEALNEMGQDGTFPIMIETSIGIAEVHTIEVHYNVELERYGYTIGYLTKTEVFDKESIQKEAYKIMEELFAQNILETTDNMRFFAHKNTPIDFENNIEGDDVILVEFIN